MQAMKGRLHSKPFLPAMVLFMSLTPWTVDACEDPAFLSVTKNPDAGIVSQAVAIRHPG